jgi:hypothetical protein
MGKVRRDGRRRELGAEKCAISERSPWRDASGWTILAIRP